MAGQPQIFDQCLVTVDGSIIGDADSITWRNENSDQDVMTILKGWCGITPGPSKTVVNISGFVPRSGIEFNFSKAEDAKSFHTLQVVQMSGAKKATAVVSFRNFSLESGVGANSKYSVEAHGTPGKFE